MLDALHSDELTNCAMSPTIKGCKYFWLNTSYNKCLKRNSSFCTCVESVIPVDEVIDAMNRIGKALPKSLRETSEGGLATTPTAKALTKRIYPQV